MIIVFFSSNFYLGSQKKCLMVESREAAFKWAKKLK